MNRGKRTRASKTARVFFCVSIEYKGIRDSGKDWLRDKRTAKKEASLTAATLQLGKIKGVKV